MNTYVYEEFVRYQKDFSKGRTDFYGAQSPLTQSEREEFLKEYYAYHTRTYGESAAYTKAVPQAQLQAACEMLANGIDTEGKLSFTAYKQKRTSAYKGWAFYTDRVFVQDGAVVFNDGRQFPVPCAKYEWGDGKPQRLAFAVKIDKSFYRKSAEGILPTTTGRYVELRKGCREIVKLYFAPDGTFCYKDGKEERYHYSLHEIGAYAFDMWNEIEIEFAEKTFDLTYNGKKHTFEYSCNAVPDTLFLGGGMQPARQWAFAPRRLVMGDGSEKSFFAPQEEHETPQTLIGKVDLPFAVGTEKNKDETLILRSSFAAQSGKKYVLHVGALDPGGEIEVNGKTLFRTDTFSPFDLDISAAVQNGDNALTVRVFPRAPEMLFAWHKHDDCYNGWFCLDVALKECEAVVTDPLVIRTRETSQSGAQFDVVWDTGLCGDGLVCDVYLQKIFPHRDERKLLKTLALQGGKLCETFCENVDIWDTENPHLYAVTAQIRRGERLLFSRTEEVGFRTVAQQDGHILLNGKKTVLKGALNMQFLPPYEDIPVNHVCPSARQIIEQVLAVKNMNGNCLRMHQLGYGCGDKRFAALCDRLGILLIWTTRLIDGVENLLWTDEWEQADEYKKQIAEVINCPSIVMWEGSNELHADLHDIDKIYDSFTATVRSVDPTRLLCPVSHLYYGGGIYDFGCKYYTTDGCYDESGNRAKSSFGWKDKDVVRSAHTYSLLLGYGAPWRDMVTQNWRLQAELFDEKQKAYIVSEFAVIGRQNPETDEAKVFINKDSYELSDETAALGFTFADEQWQLSQAYQALCAAVGVKQLRKLGADGMLWCSLWGGANNASYLKPIVDFYGYKKLAYYQLRSAFQKVTAFNSEPDVLLYAQYAIRPTVTGMEIGKKYSLHIEIVAKAGDILCEKRYTDFTAVSDRMQLAAWEPSWTDDGYYTVRYTVTEE